jgi:hypothetical protein
MTMKAFELSQDIAVSPAQPEAPPASLGIGRAISRLIKTLRSAFACYVAHNEQAWDNMVEAQLRDPNRH